MKSRHLFSLILGLSAMVLSAADPVPVTKKPTLTFYVTGVECPACVFTVNDSVRHLEGIEEVIDGQNNANFINVTFDPAKVSAHQIAQAVTDAFPLHGAPYVATLRLIVPGYIEAGNAAKVAEVFGGWKKWIEFDAANPAKGELVVKFRPLASGSAKVVAQGWSHLFLQEALTNVLPSGAKVELVKEG